ncbi:MAG: protein jag [Actinomycetota bacterium]|nr:protein jag [Actinomycetota bacterium]MCL6093956.1 protein jag [Actinomycetota bacterium]MDA8166845.1 protein jag [Actinomycetota bacterium]
MQENQNQKRNAAEAKVIGSGKTVVEAQADALAKLEAVAGPFRKDEVELIVLSEGSKGFLGMGSAMAEVEASLPGPEASQPEPEFFDEVLADEPQPFMTERAEKEEDFQPAGAEAEARLEEFLRQILEGIGLEASVVVADEYEALVGNITGEDLGLLIGRHGQTIDAIQYLANIAVFRGTPDRKRVVVDAEDYRERRAEVLKSLAERGASEVLSGKPQYELKPMSAAERRVIHMYLQDRKGIDTISEGSDPFRRVIITRSA